MEKVVASFDPDTIQLIPCLFTVVQRINERNGVGYRIKVRGEWYEVSVTACEPPDCDSDITDALP